MREDTERLLARVEMRGECLLWTGPTRNGYGMIPMRTPRRVQWTTRSAHVVAYELFVGLVPKGKELHHTCTNRACVNPAHLEPVTRLEHVHKPGGLADKYRRVRERTHCRHGHPYGDDPPIHKGGRVCVMCRVISSRKAYEKKVASLQL